MTPFKIKDQVNSLHKALPSLCETNTLILNRGRNNKTSKFICHMPIEQVLVVQITLMFALTNFTQRKTVVLIDLKSYFTWHITHEC